MFGLEKKKPETTFFLFDLEKDLASNEKKLELVQRIDSRITEIKNSLKNGSSKEFYESLGTLLNGYHALAVVLSRASKGPNTKEKK